MSDAIELTIDDLHGVTSEELVKEVAAENILPTGMYLGRTGSYKLLKNSDEHQWHPGRSFANVLVLLFDPADATKQVGRVFKKISWERRVTAGGKLDGQCRDYASFVQAVGAAPADGPFQVLEASKGVFYIVDVAEKVCAPVESLHPDHQANIRGDGDQWVTILDTAQRDHYLAEGLESMPMVQKFRRVR